MRINSTVSLATQPERRYSTGALVEQLFRTASGELTAQLCARFGVVRLGLVEEAVQEAMLAALRTWPTQGVPDRPVAWLATVARNRVIDGIRKRSRVAEREAEFDEQLHREDDASTVVDDRPGVPVDRLDLLVAICSAGLKPSHSVILALKTVFGFSIREIGVLAGLKPKTVDLRLYRARRLLRQASDAFRHDRELSRRDLDAVMLVLYAAFAQGFARPLEPSAIRIDLVTECISLGETLAGRRGCSTPSMHALLALLYLQGSRVRARHVGGAFVPLGDQDRSLWRRDWIMHGLSHMELALTGSVRSRYHIEAAIAACYASTLDGDEPAWPEILALYDDLFEHYPSSRARVSRAIARGFADGPDAALNELARLRTECQLDHDLYTVVAEAEFLAQSGDVSRAAERMEYAITLAPTEPERTYLAARLQHFTESA